MPMEELRGVAASLGFLHIRTYINNGNIIFSSIKKPSTVTKEPEEGLLHYFGFSIKVLVISSKNIRTFATRTPKTYTIMTSTIMVGNMPLNDTNHTPILIRRCAMQDGAKAGRVMNLPLRAVDWTEVTSNVACQRANTGGGIHPR